LNERRRIPPLAPFEEEIGFTRAVRAGDRIFVSGITAVMPDGTTPSEAGAQADRCFQEIIRYIEELGGRAEDVVRVRMFVIDISDADAVNAAFSRPETRPADGTPVAIASLYHPDWKVEIKADAVIDG
jgi:enamine deaminase RidA (YjgF/YER057c/UK114 family)